MCKGREKQHVLEMTAVWMVLPGPSRATLGGRHTLPCPPAPASGQKELGQCLVLPGWGVAAGSAGAWELWAGTLPSGRIWWGDGGWGAESRSQPRGRAKQRGCRSSSNSNICLSRTSRNKWSGTGPLISAPSTEQHSATSHYFRVALTVQ